MTDAVVRVGATLPAFYELLSGDSSGLIIGLTPKVGCTSMRLSIKQAGVRFRQWSVQDLRESQRPVRIYLRHPIERFSSCWAFFYPTAKFPRSIPQVPPHATIETLTDYVLDGAMNEHWHPQLDLYQGCNVAEVYQFEHVHDTWPSDIELLHLNPAPVEKPVITYRRLELEEYYRDDMIAWIERGPVRDWVYEDVGVRLCGA